MQYAHNTKLFRKLCIFCIPIICVFIFVFCFFSRSFTVFIDDDVAAHIRSFFFLSLILLLGWCGLKILCQLLNRSRIVLFYKSRKFDRLDKRLQHSFVSLDSSLLSHHGRGSRDSGPCVVCASCRTTMIKHLFCVCRFNFSHFYPSLLLLRLLLPLLLLLLLF